MLQNRTILLGVTGSIAAFKAAELLRLLVGDGARVHPILTRAATHFVAPLTFDVLAGRPCLVDQFAAEEMRSSFIPADDPDRSPVVHIDLAQRADACLVAPATANLLGKIAHGIADDLLSVTIMATRAPVLFAPAMNSQMWANPIVEANVARLRELGYHFVGPEAGELACRTSGAGRMVEPAAIVAALCEVLATDRRRGELTGKTVLVSAGRTEEPIDPVRTISNRSSGRMGYALAAAARDLGATVVLVSGPASVAPPTGVELRRVETAAQMETAILDALPHADCLIMAAAVADFRPRHPSSDKLRRAGGPDSIALEPTSDILVAAAAVPGKRLHVGFALETGDGVAAARRKLQDKRLDLIILNRADEPDAGIDVETNRVVLIDASSEQPLPLMQKTAVAEKIMAEVVRRLAAGGGGG